MRPCRRARSGPRVDPRDRVVARGDDRSGAVPRASATRRLCRQPRRVAARSAACRRRRSRSLHPPACADPSDRFTGPGSRRRARLTADAMRCRVRRVHPPRPARRPWCAAATRRPSRPRPRFGDGRRWATATALVTVRIVGRKHPCGHLIRREVDRAGQHHRGCELHLQARGTRRQLEDGATHRPVASSARRRVRAAAAGADVVGADVIGAEAVPSIVVMRRGRRTASTVRLFACADRAAPGRRTAPARRALTRCPHPRRTLGVSEQTATEADVRAVAARAREAAAELAPLSRAAKDAALHAMADALDDATDDGRCAANARDVDAGRTAGTAESLLDRLALNPERVAAMAQGLRDVAGAAGSGRRGAARLRAAERPRDPPGARAVRRDRDDLRGPSQRDRRRRRGSR